MKLHCTIPLLFTIFVVDNLMGCHTSQNISNIKMNVYLDALDRLLIAHINRCGRLIFNDFLIYLDILSYFLFADGVNEDKVK